MTVRLLTVAAAIVLAITTTAAEARQRHHWGYTAPVKHYRVAVPKATYTKARRVIAVAVYAPSFEFGHLQVAFGAPRTYASYKPTAGVFGTHTKVVSAPRVARAGKVRVETPAFARRTTPVSAGRSLTNARPQQCYGIAWCGCWMAAEFGLPRILKIAGRTLNLYMADDWRYMGTPTNTPGPKVAVIWPHKHVGVIRQAFSDGTALVESGNYGNQHHAVVARISIRGLILRQL